MYSSEICDHLRWPYLNLNLESTRRSADSRKTGRTKLQRTLVDPYEDGYALSWASGYWGCVDLVYTIWVSADRAGATDGDVGHL